MRCSLKRWICKGRDRTLLALLVSCSSVLVACSNDRGDEPGGASQASRSLAQRLEALAEVLKTERGLRDFPSLDAERLARVGDEIVVADVTPPGTDVEFKVAAHVFELPVEALFVVVADAANQTEWIPDLEHSEVLETSEAGLVEHVYQGLDTTFSTDEWVTRITRNRALFERTEGRCWELWWELLEPDRAGEWIERLPEDRRFRSAKRPRSGRGAWLLVPLDATRTYVEYATTSDIGWRKAVVREFGDGALRDMLRGLERAASAAWAEPGPGLLEIADVRGVQSGALAETLREKLVAAGRDARGE